VLDGEPGEYVALGRRFTYASTNATFIPGVTETGTSANATVKATGGPQWQVLLAAPRGQPLVPGTYEHATRSGFRAAGVPGIEVFGDSRGCNTSTGRFVIQSIQFSDGGSSLVHLHATFEQHCEGQTPALFGEIEF
jgi:hypothetical protein